MEFDKLIEQILSEQFAGEFGMEDTSMNPSTALEITKFIDPSGILSWNDAYRAYKEFEQTPTPYNGLMLALALGSIIPVGKYYFKSIKTLIKAGRMAQAGDLLRIATPKLEQTLAKTPTLVTTKGMKLDEVRKALKTTQQQIDDTLKEISKLEKQKTKTPRTLKNNEIMNWFENNEMGRWLKYNAQTVIDAYRTLSDMYGKPAITAMYLADAMRKDPEINKLSQEYAQQIAQFLIDNPQYLEALKVVAGKE